MSEVVIEIGMSKKVADHIDEVQQRLKLQSTSEVFSLAMALFDFCDSEIRYRKGTLVVRYEHGEEYEIPWPPPAVKVT